MKEKTKRIVFFGTPEFARYILQEIIREGFHVAAVVTAPDKPAGRGRKLRASEVKKYAESHEIPILQPVNLKSGEFLDELASFKADVFVVVAFRMLPESVWKMPALGTFNLHASLLPAYRGAAPINWAIIRGEKVTGVTTFFINEKIDTGDIILQEKVEITPGMNAGELHDQLMIVGAKTVNATLKRLFAGDLSTHPQPPGETSYAPKLNPGNTRINWEAPAGDLKNFIRGLSPYPGAWTEWIEGEKTYKVKIYSGSFEKKEHDFKTGQLSVVKENGKRKLFVAHQEGFYRIDEIQFPGKRRMDINSFLNGYSWNQNAYVK